MASRLFKNQYLSRLCIGSLALIMPVSACFAAGGAGYNDPIAPIILGVTTILFFAVLGRFAARKLSQPSVLGELIVGIIAGNLFYWLGLDLIIILREGPSVFDIMGYTLKGMSLDEAVKHVLGQGLTADMVYAVLSEKDSLTILKIAHVVDIFSRYGVIFLLFLVGLEISVDDLRRTGVSALRVASIGVIIPIILALLVSNYFLPDLDYQADLFVAAALSATSIGITARVLADLNKTRSRESHIILGAAMIDDILGLILLAIVSSIVIQGTVEVRDVIRTVALASLFISSAIVMGPFLLEKMTFLLRQMDITEAKLFISFIFVMIFAWFATILGLATIVGAFVAGIILNEGYFSHWGDTTKHQFTIKDLVAPIESILAPLFFILIGIQVKCETFFDWHVLALASALLIAAIIGKLVSGLGASREYNRFAIGLGMMPRGEVGLVFASIGKSLGVINDELFAAVVLMVIGTTLITPPLLKWRLK